MSSQGTDDPDDEGDASEKPSGKVHWINHATFYLTVILAVLTAGTLCVYWLQLQQMITVTKTAQDSAYDACMSAQIARQTLLEYEAGEVDSHRNTLGILAQASVGSMEEAANLRLGILQFTPPAGTPGFQPNVPVAGFSVENLGKTMAHGIDISYTVQVLPSDMEPNLHKRGMYSDKMIGGVIAPGSQSISVAHVLDENGEFIKDFDSQSEELKTGKKYLVGFGKANYVDVFGVKHWQTFCNFHDNTLHPATKHPVLRHLACGAYNNADSNTLFAEKSSSELSPPKSPIKDVVCSVPKH